jgi:plasmid replication initiation protein
LRKALAHIAKSALSVPKGANLGSERRESGFRKARIQNAPNWVPDNAKKVLDNANFSVPDSAKLAYGDMMALLPNRHPQLDFFVLDIADVVPKDDTASMAHPIFSLATKPDMRHLFYQNGENTLKITPSGNGLPTIFDKDILIFCISQLMHRKNRGETIGKRVRFSARELMIATNRSTDDKSYIRLEAAFQRLIGTTFTTNIAAGDYEETRILTLLESGSGFVVKRKTRRLDYCEVILSDWLMGAIEGNAVVTISNDYFRLRRPLERRIYEIARKHCGSQPRWQVGLAKLQEKTGSNAPLKRFRLNLREIIAADHTPFYRIELTKDDLVIFRPREQKRALSKSITIPLWAEERARQIAQEKGWDYHALEREWLAFANNPKDVGAAFVGFCKLKEALR